MTEKEVKENIRKEILRSHKTVSKLSPDEKDLYLAAYSVFTEKLVEYTHDMSEMLLELVRAGKNSKEIKEIKEIENILSLGPTWLNFTRKVKKKGDK
jgi:hypothetical protein